MKILILTQNINDQDTFNKGLALAKQWCSTINLPLDFTLQSTAVQFNSIPFSNPDAKGYTVDPVQVFQVGKTYGDYDCYLLIYDWTKIIPQPTNPSDGGRGLSIPTQWYATYPEVLAQFLLHELCHYFFGGQTAKPDITHLLVDGTLQAQYPALYAQYKQLQPQDYYLYLLKQFVPQTPTVTIVRGQDNGTEILGSLTTSDGQFGCCTLERSYKNNQKNISAIPTGTYQVKKTFSWKFGFVYEVQSVPNRSGIYLHEGNYFFNSEGCILLGSSPSDINHDGQIDILNSKLIRQALQNKMNWQPFTLTIQ